MFSHGLGIEHWPDAVTTRLLGLSMDLACVAGYDGYFRELSDGWSHVLGYALEELTTRPVRTSS